MTVFVGMLGNARAQRNTGGSKRWIAICWGLICEIPISSSPSSFQLYEVIIYSSYCLRVFVHHSKIDVFVGIYIVVVQLEAALKKETIEFKLSCSAEIQLEIKSLKGLYLTREFFMVHFVVFEVRSKSTHAVKRMLSEVCIE